MSEGRDRDFVGGTNCLLLALHNREMVLAIAKPVILDRSG
jgi:hypothetical protein